MNTDAEDTLKRWTAKRRTALILEIVRGDTTVAEAARTYGLTVGEIEEWRDRFLAGAENALRSRPLDEDAQKDHEVTRRKQTVGELVMQRDVIKAAIKGHPSLRQMRDE